MILFSKLASLGSLPTHSPNPSCNLTDDVTYSKVKDLTTVFSILKGERERKEKEEGQHERRTFLFQSWGQLENGQKGKKM